MHVVTNISTIFSQKKKRQSAIKNFAEKQFLLAWEAKVKKSPKNLKHLIIWPALILSLNTRTLKSVSLFLSPSLPLPLTIFFPPTSPSLSLIANLFLSPAALLLTIAQRSIL